ncbi:MAG TPA: hypothetical protein PKE21_10155 [Flavobacteriales bacterium]|nr:hypothetical protein [Flavobacteriales bacterium]HMR27829.1 hypothetical protein [Flavobacteriales bacterium]
MRFLPFLFLLVTTGAYAQPGWRELEFSFILEHHGVEVPAKDLRQGNDFIFEVEGERARPFSINNSSFSTLEFPAERSDITQHRDTLWLRIRHRHEGVMEIAFPPRAGLRTNHPYPTDHLIVAFAPGRISVTDLPKFLRVTGTLVGLNPLMEFFPGTIMAASRGCDTVQYAIDRLRPTFDFGVHCRTTRTGSLPEAVLNLFAGGPYHPDIVMRIRGTALGGEWPLDTVRFAPTQFRVMGWHRLELDTAVVRDTVFGWDHAGYDRSLGVPPPSSVVHLSHAQPTTRDTLVFRFWWLGGGENVGITQRVTPDQEGEHILEFSVRRSPVDLPGMSMRGREITVRVPPLPAGRVRMRVKYNEDPSFPAPRYAALDGHYLNVR